MTTTTKTPTAAFEALWLKYVSSGSSFFGLLRKVRGFFLPTRKKAIYLKGNPI